MDDEQTPQPQTAAGRSAEFAGGQHGGGAVHAATAIPSQQAEAGFSDAASVLLAANQYSGAGLGSSAHTMSVKDPYSMAMKATLQQSGDGAEQESSGG
jgi:hypothetical protein